MRPLIGITTSTVSTEWRQCAAGEWHALRRDYADLVAAAGGTPVLLPAVSSPAASELLARLDGLVLSGGGDVHPRRYGESPAPKLGPVDEVRDEFELTLAREALARERPVLGICRGLQVLVVAAGGALWQDLPSQAPNSRSHGNAGQPVEHPVTLEPGSRLALLIGQTELTVSSSHHQAPRTIGGGLVAVGWSSDGVVEAVEHPDRPYALGVQWHPERGWRAHPEQVRLIAGLVAAGLPSSANRE